MIEYSWRGDFSNPEVQALHAQGFQLRPGATFDWWDQVNRHSLGWVGARDGGRLVGWVNLAWDGRTHATVLDTVVEDTHRRQGVAKHLVERAVEAARRAGCAWLHVDFEAHLAPLYLDACGFRPTTAGLVDLRAGS